MNKILNCGLFMIMLVYIAQFFMLFKAPSFPEFETLLKNTIKRLGGQVFPKLNWSAPKVSLFSM